ncbi:invasion-associated locus B family protein [Roseobacter cerasinus]|uniref:Invasion-associated locus B family protein n=1 Tax=Roseobacter cerasinus TaxID=2602289 RepID=A0A640VRH1_9RHOB|nr:invasion associated locus B family protein [Roseobacter cerasinus]GFE50214.1 invasion-associated locus B family protein [Roseobacter cerasinus]
MPKLTSIYTAGTALTLSLVVAASMSIAQSDTSEDNETPPAPSVIDGLSVGEVVTEGPQVGQRYTTETIGDWTMRCVKTEDDKDPCEMFQLLEDDEGNPMSEVTVFQLPENDRFAAGATIIVPLETALQAGLTMKIDTNPTRRFPYAFCDRVGCYAQIALADEDVTILKRGNKADLDIVPFASPDTPVKVTLSLTGFTAAYEKAVAPDQ